MGQAATLSSEPRSKAVVGIVSCKTYGAEVKTALRQCFDLVGGVGEMVRNKTVTVKLNLTGTNFTRFLGKPVGETYMTHSATVMALLALLFDARRGPRPPGGINPRPRRIENEPRHGRMGCQRPQRPGQGQVQNTRNLGAAKTYATLRVPFGGYMFSSFDLNHSYHDTDVMISLAKLKRHLTAGVTLSMKNLFGVTPNSLYGWEAGSERATEGRVAVARRAGFGGIKLPGIKPGIPYRDPFSRVPRIVVDICAARPIDLAIIDGISSMTGGEGPWCAYAAAIKPISPGLLIAGRNAVSTDAVATAVMGYDPRAARGRSPLSIATMACCWPKAPDWAAPTWPKSRSAAWPSGRRAVHTIDSSAISAARPSHLVADPGV